MNYEFHITDGDHRYIRNLNCSLNSFEEGTPITGIENLDEKGFTVFTDWMISERAVIASGHEAALEFLQRSFFRNGWRLSPPCKPNRLKIEVQYDDDINPQEYIYIETHFNVDSNQASKLSKGISRNIISGELIATERSYSCIEYKEFAENHLKKGHRVELCLFDSNVQHDSSWIHVPKRTSIFSPLTYPKLMPVYKQLFVNF